MDKPNSKALLFLLFQSRKSKGGFRGGDFILKIGIISHFADCNYNFMVKNKTRFPLLKSPGEKNYSYMPLDLRGQADVRSPFQIRTATFNNVALLVRASCIKKLYIRNCTNF
jgi:hypothetical protein